MESMENSRDRWPAATPAAGSAPSQDCQTALLEQSGNGSAKFNRRAHGGNAGLFQRRILGVGRTLAAGNNGAGMAHALARRRSHTGDIGHHRLFDVVGNIFGRLFLGRAADFTHHDDAFGVRVVFKQLKAVDKAHAVNGIAANANAGRLAQTGFGGLVNRFIGQGSRARDNAHAALFVNGAGHDANLALFGRDDARAVGPDQSNIVVVFKRCAHAQHVEHRNAFGNTGDYPNAGISRLQNGIGRKRRRHKNHGGIGTGLLNRFIHGVEDRQAQVILTALAGRDATNHLRAVLDGLLGVKAALAAGNALTDDFGVFVNQYAHCKFLQARAASTALRAPSLRSSAGMMSRLLLAKSALPLSTLVPSRRTTSGTSISMSLTALMMPSAIRSQRTMPPKMLTRMALTLSPERISRSEERRVGKAWRGMW